MAVLMVVSPVVGFGYGFLALRRGLPLTGPTYYTGSMLLVFVVYFVVYQLLTQRAFGRADPAQLVAWTRATTPRDRRSRRLLLWTGSGARSWAVTAALLALAAVVAVLVVGELRREPMILVASFLVVVTSWTMVAFTFAVAYLRLDAEQGGLEFPGGDSPVWSDYVYLAVQVNATFSSSDVDATTPAARSLVTTHTLLAFLFNTVIVALLVSALVTLAG